MLRATLRAGRSAAAREEGFTLSELLVAMVLSLIVMGAGVTVFIASVRTQPDHATRGASIQQARTALERITREVRQGWSAPAATSNQLSLLTYVKSVGCGGAPAASAIPCRVTYTCTAGTCVRVEAQPDGLSPGPSETVVTGLSSSDVFGYSPSSTAPSNIGITFSFPSKRGDDAITVQDGVTLRNPSGSS